MKDETGLRPVMDTSQEVGLPSPRELVYTAGGGGGATFTINIKYIHPRRPGVVCSLTSNIGDSPAFQIFNVRGQGRKLIETTRGFNADNIEGFKQYAQECVDCDLPIPEVIVGRWNLPGNFKVPWVTDEYGRPKAIQVYQTVWMTALSLFRPTPIWSASTRTARIGSRDTSSSEEYSRIVIARRIWQLRLAESTQLSTLDAQLGTEQYRR